MKIRLHKFRRNICEIFGLYLLLFLSLGFTASCNKEFETRFELLESEKTGIDFANQLEDQPDFNIIDYLYFYDGGGVSIGDVNNDGLPDIYFTANMLPNRLYLNKGNLEFEDITQRAGVSGTAGWTTGTTMADVNGDSLLDIYVSSVNYLSKSGRNQLFINNGDSTFTDRAEKFGLDFKGYSKQASFFDYDNDGDLDMYLLNHAVHTDESFTRAEKRLTYSEDAGDKLFRNDENTFTEVTKEAGIYSSVIGYGLAATVSDINTDGCQDIYVSNDFHENDYLYINNCDGSFREVLQNTAGHTSRASMGSDIADFNNDGRPDIFVLDMLPYDETTLKTAISAEPYEVYQIQRQYGYHPQLIRNTLQLNLGKSPQGKLLFSEIAQYANVHATDWSWSSLFFDMDNDGRKDLFITNGIYRRPNDLDYLAFVRRDNVQKMLNKGTDEEKISVIKSMPHVKIPNMAYRNEGDYSFTNQSGSYGFDIGTYSNGMAYGDLDNDGDLDLVINNVNSPAHIYQNATRGRERSNFLKIKLKSSGKNTHGIGTKVYFFNSGDHQFYEQMPTRGFLSSVEPVIIAGMNRLASIDSLRAVWPDGSYQTIVDVKTNQTVELNKADASGSFRYPENKNDGASAVFKNITEEKQNIFHHRENSMVPYSKQSLMPHMLSTQGPKMAVADINNDGLDDFYIGGAKYQSGALFVQGKNGNFESTNKLLFKQDEPYEDTDATFFDANGDGAQDLYVVSGGNDYSVNSQGYEDRLYLNDGNGTFVRIYDAFPAIFQNGATVAPADYDKDGDIDLFIGNRSVPQNYGYNPVSYLLINNGQGRFSVANDETAPGLRETGMVTDAVWEDVNGDESPDLIVVGEWMPITIFINKAGQLNKAASSTGLAETNGWWNHINSGDFDRDGDIDFIAGNMGLNSFLRPSKQQPLVMYLKDFNKDGQIDPIIGYTREGEEYPVASRDELLTQFKFLRSKYRTYEDFGGQTIRDIFGQRLEDSVQVKKACMFNSVFLDNKGDGTFTIQSLPPEAQFAPIFSTSVADFDDDGHLDVLAGGNFFDVKPSLGGRYDASYGWFLKGNGSSDFDILTISESGFAVDGQIRDIKKLGTTNEKFLILVSQNDDELLFFRTNNSDE